MSSEGDEAGLREPVLNVQALDSCQEREILEAFARRISETQLQRNVGRLQRRVSLVLYYKEGRLHPRERLAKWGTVVNNCQC